jgi:signal transduction histidine kinase
MELEHWNGAEAIARFMRLGAKERALLAAHWRLLDGALEPALDQIYGEIFAEPRLARHFGDPDQVARARAAQAAYWRGLFGDGVHSPDRARRVGQAHARLKIDHALYLSAYAVVLEHLVGVLSTAPNSEISETAKAQVAAALIKSALLDAGVVITAYIEAERQESAAKSQLFADMAHDLRTPLHAVIGYSELVLEDWTREQGLARDLNNVLSGAQRLARTVEGLLTLARVQAGRMTLAMECVDIVALAHIVLDDLRTELERNGNRIAAPDHVVRLATVDPDKVTECLMILLSNAARFTQNGSISVRVYDTMMHNGVEAICFEISDTGVGMTKEALDALFGNGDETFREGAAVGLSVVRSLARLMGGDVLAASEVGRGSTFTLWLPGQPLPRAQ